MSRRRALWRRVKRYRTYTVEEIAEALGVHLNTVRNWLRSGLNPIDTRRPILIRAEVLIAFLQGRSRKGKVNCAPNEFFCVHCKSPKVPAGELAEYRAMTPMSGMLSGICPSCERMIYRRTGVSGLELIRQVLDVVACRGVGN